MNDSIETIIFFTNNEYMTCYEELAESEVCVEIMKLSGKISIGERAISLAIIDCGDLVDIGLGLLKELKQARADVPVFFITEASSGDVVIKAFKLGVRDYFIKPLNQLEFIEAVERILHIKRNLRTASISGKDEPPQLFLLPDGVPPRLMRATGFIEENFFATLSLEMIAQQACLSKYHFCRLFKRHVGVSPMEYCVYRRIEHAQKLLSKPNQTITITAFRSGFNDVTEFIRQFKKITGITPGVYRKSLLAPQPQK